MNTRPWRNPQSFVHGTDSPVVIVPGRIAAILVNRLGIDTALRTEVRGRDAELDAPLLAIADAAQQWRDSFTGSALADAPEPEQRSSVIGSTGAASLLGITDRAIRQAIATTRLPATKVAGRWYITRDDVEHYRAARKAT